MTPHSAKNEDGLLATLALALVDKPRANLQELAAAAGVSKATLYRFCRTREELIERLMAHGAELMQRSLKDAAPDEDTPLEILRHMILRQLEHREMTAFLIYFWKPDTLQDTRWTAAWTDYQDALDALFLRGQREGSFRIDISAASLTEALISLVTGLMDAERRGRVARAGIPAVVEALFLRGAAA